MCGEWDCCVCVCGEWDCCVCVCVVGCVMARGCGCACRYNSLNECISLSVYAHTYFSDTVLLFALFVLSQLSVAMPVRAYGVSHMCQCSCGEWDCCVCGEWDCCVCVCVVKGTAVCVW